MCIRDSYTVVSEATREQEFASKRQLFLTEQGYGYEIVPAEALSSTDGEEVGA